MADPEKLIVTAGNLMRMALACLDEASESDASTYLQHAIDTLDGVPPLRPGEEIPQELIDRFLTRSARR